MSADVIAAAHGTLRDLDAALAAHEAAQAVAWLEEQFDERMASLDEYAQTVWNCSWADAPWAFRMTLVRTSQWAPCFTRPMISLEMLPGADGELDPDHAQLNPYDETDYWTTEMSAAGWPRPLPQNSLIPPRLDEDEHECRCHLHPPCSHCTDCRPCAERVA